MSLKAAQVSLPSLAPGGLAAAVSLDQIVQQAKETPQLLLEMMARRPTTLATGLHPHIDPMAVRDPTPRTAIFPNPSHDTPPQQRYLGGASGGAATTAVELPLAEVEVLAPPCLLLP
jgi:hypothetical protein